ncbi:hypothetical protein U8Q05_27025 (plasmid) [Rhizobium ruizarguesonis]|nr:hypothetical protein U8Q05_27025 [Rhizobium ruizarguesonis]
MKKRLGISETIAQAVTQVERAIDAMREWLEIAQAVENEPAPVFTSPADLAAAAIRKQEETVQSLIIAKDSIQARGFEAYRASAPRDEIEKFARQATAYDKPIGEAQRALEKLKLQHAARPYTYFNKANASLQAQLAHEAMRGRAISMRRGLEGQLKDHQEMLAVLQDLAVLMPSDRHLQKGDEAVLNGILRKIDAGLSNPLRNEDLRSLRAEPDDDGLQELNDRAIELLKDAEKQSRGHAATASVHTMVTACFKATNYEMKSAGDLKTAWQKYGEALARSIPPSAAMASAVVCGSHRQ